MRTRSRLHTTAMRQHNTRTRGVSGESSGGGASLSSRLLDALTAALAGLSCSAVLLPTLPTLPTLATTGPLRSDS